MVVGEVVITTGSRIRRVHGERESRLEKPRALARVIVSQLRVAREKDVRGVVEHLLHGESDTFDGHDRRQCLLSKAPCGTECVHLDLEPELDGGAARRRAVDLRQPVVLERPERRVLKCTARALVHLVHVEALQVRDRHVAIRTRGVELVPNKFYIPTVCASVDPACSLRCPLCSR